MPVPAVFVLLLTLLGISAGLRLPRCAVATSKQGSLPIRVAVLQELLRSASEDLTGRAG